MKIEQIEKRIEKVLEKINKTEGILRGLKKDLGQLLQEKENAELQELKSFMKEYQISPVQAKAIIEETRRLPTDEEDHPVNDVVGN